MTEASPGTRRILRWRVGDARITRIVDLEASGLTFLLPSATPENLRGFAWLAPYLVRSGEAVAAIQSFVIEIGRRRVLVDTAAGEAARAAIPARIEHVESYLEQLQAAGFPPDTIDIVIHTHLHFDHVGWNLRPANDGYAPTFRNARHLIAGEEWAYWSGRGAAEDRAPVEHTIRPLLKAEIVDFVEPGWQIVPGIALEPTPGHTPGHISVRIRSNGCEAVISGDLVHHPAQLARPDWICTWDADPTLARETREQFLEQCARSRVLVFGTHFARAPAGHVVRDGAVYRFEPSAPAA